MTWARDVVCVGAWFVFVSELGRGAGWLTESTSDMGKKGLERPGIIGDRKKHTEKKKKKKKKKKEKKKKKRRSAASLMPTPRPALLRGDAIPKPMITPQTAHHHRHHHHHHNHPILCLAPLFPQIIFLDFNSKTATTTPATTAASVSQNAQHIQARWRCFFFWLASHESLDGASAVMVVQKRNWAARERAKRQRRRVDVPREAADAPRDAIGMPLLAARVPRRRGLRRGRVVGGLRARQGTPREGYGLGYKGHGFGVALCVCVHVCLGWEGDGVALQRRARRDGEVGG
jgi:hypothetical protein